MPSSQATPQTESKATERPGCPRHYPSYTTASDTYVYGLYHETLDDNEVESFLEGTGCYDIEQKRWSIPENPLNRGTLVDALYSIWLSVVQRFLKPTEPEVERHVINTYGHPECEQKVEHGYAACPVLVVPATGPSFDLLPGQRSTPDKVNVGYPCMATYCTVKLNSTLGSTDEQVHEMEAYAQYVILNCSLGVPHLLVSRQILRDQPNRLFVRSLVLTENHARLVHFDRAGAEISPPFNIHEHAATFVRLIAGLSSADERVLGFDTSVQWTIVNRKKTKGTVTTTGPNGGTKAYPILGQVPTLRDDIRGRATTCWHVQDPDTLEELVVKDSWRIDDLRGEYELLELVKDIPGVVHMVSYETGRGETKDFRCPSTSGRFQNRVATRVTTKAYGRSIAYFTSVVQLLSAIRDAISGKSSLVLARLDHPDSLTSQVTKGSSPMTSGYFTVTSQLKTFFLEEMVLQMGNGACSSTSTWPSDRQMQNPQSKQITTQYTFFYVPLFTSLIPTL